jgi:pimeloyl-ACP methyl ester carboxylesterase
MSPTGVTVVVVQNRETDCMAMLDHFFGHRFDLQQLAQAFRERHGDRYDVVVTVDPAHVETKDPASAYAIAEFMLNLLPISRPPARQEVANYLAKHCRTNGNYRLSVHQDFLQIRRRQPPAVQGSREKMVSG